jgi:superfamily II DNA or RNA helicase
MQKAATDFAPREGEIVSGSLFSEPMRVETVRSTGSQTWVLGLVGVSSERFRSVTLTASELATLKVSTQGFTYAGDAHLTRLGLQAYALGIAYEYDPYFGLSISRVDPLPHQLEAVYDYLLKLARVRFLLADDAGAGKTIMAGLLIKELKLRGLAERILIVCPANLTFQWQRELNEKFGETFVVLKGATLRDQFGINHWQENPRVITSLDLAKRADIVAGLRQVKWDLAIVDEAHRMSATPNRKTERYVLGELLRDAADHLLLLTATPHKGDPVNFSLFLQLLDEDAYADVTSIRQAMERRRAPFYLRRTKEAMVHFPERLPDGTWQARKIFTKRIPHTADFQIDGREFELYRRVTAFVKSQSNRAAAQGDDPRAMAVGFLMAMYQRRLASSTYALRHSLDRRALRLAEGLKKAQDLARLAPPELPDAEELEEMEEFERERLEQILEAITIASNPDAVRAEIGELKELAVEAQEIENTDVEAKLSRLKVLLHEQGFFDDLGQRLLLFTEFKDTLDYLVGKLKSWGFKVGFIHGGMKPGTRDQPGTRLYAEQQFQEGAIQVLVATEAAGEGINLQSCNILFNYDIPWNPNRLEQRMGRIHRYLQTKDCFIFNFVATNTIEGKVLQKLLERLQEIRDALDDDSVFNVIGEILPAAQIERVLREYYAGSLGEGDLEDRVLRDVKEERFRAITQNALEGLATKKLNLEMLVERRARAQERRLVPETTARFMAESARMVPLTLKPLPSLPHSFEPGPTPQTLRSVEQEAGWKGAVLATRYPKISTDREIADKNSLEWVTPGHPLFEALRRHTLGTARDAFATGACFYSLAHTAPARIDFYRARVVDGLGDVVHERLYGVEMNAEGDYHLQDPAVLGNMQFAPLPAALPPVSSVAEPVAWLNERALMPFLEEIRQEREAEVKRIQEHIDLSLTELIRREDDKIGRFFDEVERGVEGAAGLLKMAEDRHAALFARRQRRAEELARQRSLSLQGVERMAGALVLPHPDRNQPQMQNLHPDPETEAIGMQTVIEYERSQGRHVEDVHEKNLGYDITSLDTSSGELRLIEVKGLAGETGTVALTPNEKRVAEDRRDCYWLYVVTRCKRPEGPLVMFISDPARLDWHEVRKVEHYQLSVSALTPASCREPK